MARGILRLIAVAVALVGAALVAYLSLRPWHLRWGATDEELRRRLPGDEIIPNPNTLNTTRAVTIDAPVSAVWPWLVQMGVGRAGWYSYDLLDNLARHSAERIVPEWQELKVGDLVPAGPKEGLRVRGMQVMPAGDIGFRVAAMEPEHYLVLTSRGLGEWQHPEPTTSWAFVLEPVEGHRTRLIERIRATGPLRPQDMPGNLFWEAADFVMMRQQLRNIKKRAERATR